MWYGRSLSLSVSDAHLLGNVGITSISNAKNSNAEVLTTGSAEVNVVYYKQVKRPISEIRKRVSVLPE